MRRSIKRKMNVSVDESRHKGRVIVKVNQTTNVFGRAVKTANPYDTTIFHCYSSTRDFLPRYTSE